MITAIIDRMGVASSRAQGLGAIITTASRLCMNVHTGQRLYIIRDSKNEKKINGLLKIGRKKLFLRDNVGRIRELNAMCILDFYVHESCQRQGIGKTLFEYMLKAEHLPPSKFAVDRPSHKLLAFLRKHYQLSKFTPQNNNFVVFDKYFLSNSAMKLRKSSVKPDLPLGTAGKPSGSRGPLRAPQLSQSPPPYGIFDTADTKVTDSPWRTPSKTKMDGKQTAESVSSLLNASFDSTKQGTSYSSFRNTPGSTSTSSSVYGNWKDTKGSPYDEHRNGRPGLSRSSQIRTSYDTSSWRHSPAAGTSSGVNQKSNRSSIVFGPATEYRTMDPKIVLNAGSKRLTRSMNI
eukprot:CAMPEP_0184503326 /NCGR_PEP_ID=MMETSP0113_2-20130426/51829_1 /TAXON_ID=91329 /ORGANISM="Norrisiella sphaerica, Strain BC52" /LENGTH=345 /DNA_ID=CAMNT_0026892809 /DNA_START=126 /DNA_END=1163 /DNA_ORIENTATION=+